MLTAAILAGGRARRLGGRAKATLPVGGTPILARQLEAVAAVTDRVIIVANEPELYEGAGVPIVADLVPGRGALGGILTALAAARGDYVLVVAADLPFLTARFLAHLARTAETSGADLVIPRTPDGLQPLCAVYAPRLLDTIRQRVEAGNLKVVDLAGEARVHEIGPEEIAKYDPDGILFFNVNTPDDYARALALAAARTRALRPDAS